MRNPSRLNEFYAEMNELHQKFFPDLRFGQLIMNFLYWAEKDPYFWEEGDFLDKFREYCYFCTEQVKKHDE